MFSMTMNDNDDDDGDDDNDDDDDDDDDNDDSDCDDGDRDNVIHHSPDVFPGQRWDLHLVVDGRMSSGFPGSGAGLWRRPGNVNLTDDRSNMSVPPLSLSIYLCS